MEFVVGTTTFHVFLSLKVKFIRKLVNYIIIFIILSLVIIVEW